MLTLKAKDILNTAAAAGVQLAVTPDGGLKVTPASAMTPEIRELLKSHKPELVDYLRNRVTPTAANDPAPAPQDFTKLTREVFEERAAIAEHDGGLPRPHAEEMARLHTDYLVHHWGCKTCIAAGKGYGLRCGSGAALWNAYDAFTVGSQHGKVLGRGAA